MDLRAVASVSASGVVRGSSGEYRSEIVVVMGVSGSGKSTIGSMLASALHAPFVDADELHSEANRRKMAEGVALSDADRKPWLLLCNAQLVRWREDGSPGVLACSALKESYRRILCSGLSEPDVVLVHLEVPKDELARRLAEREHPFMNPSLLTSQLETLETPRSARVVDATMSRDEVVRSILVSMGSRGDGSTRADGSLERG